MIKQKSIQEVLAVASIEDVIQDFVELRRRGVNMIGLCPFHDEKTPSFTVSPAKNIYKCFGCGKGGDPVGFIMEHEQMNYPEAIRWLADRYNIELEEDIQDNEAYQQEKQQKESLKLVNTFAKEYFEKNLWETTTGKSIGLSYFKERGFREATIRKFGLGYAMPDYDDFTKTAVSKKYNIEYLRTLGLTSKKDLDFFRDRVMFTISDVRGNPIAFAGRTLMKGTKIPKYINSPETPIYNKSNVLYGMHLAKSKINAENNCFLVEGYTDVISLHQGGIENVVASSGTALTEGQIKLIKRYTDTVTLLYDGDAAGIKAASRGLDLILRQDMNVFLIMLPEGHDPDSFITAVGKSEFDTFVAENRSDFIEFRARDIAATYVNDPIGKANAINDIIKSLTLIPDSIKRTLYIQQCAHILDLEEVMLQREVAKALKTRINVEKKRGQYKKDEIPADQQATWITPPTAAKQTAPPTIRSDVYQEKDLVRISLLQGDKMIEIEEQEISIAEFIYLSIQDVANYFDNTLYRDVIYEIYEMVANDTFSHQHFIHHSNNDIQSLAIDILAGSEKYTYAKWQEKGVPLNTQVLPEQNFDKDSHYAILRFKYKKLKKVIKLIDAKIIETGEANDEENLILAVKAKNKLLEEKTKLADKLGTVYD